MEEEWIVRVEGAEYGPVDEDTLREWQSEGRLVAGNPVRRSGDSVWMRAGEIPGIFPDVVPPPPQVMPRSFTQLIVESFQIYGRGFRLFPALTVLTALPSFCAQLSAPSVELPAGAMPDLHAVMAMGFSLLMALLGLALWPVFIAGIQIATSAVLEARPLGLIELLRSAISFWPRVAILCAFVYGSYFFWTALPVLVILALAFGGPSLVSLFVSLLMLTFQVWITARLFTNFLFWQQFAVVEGLDGRSALKRSKELARSGDDRPWYQRPLWRGALLASIWCAVIILLNIGPEWELVRSYFHQLTVSQDPQAMVEALSKSKPQGANPFSVALGLLQVVLRPLLGISFVLLYFDTKSKETPRSVN